MKLKIAAAALTALFASSAHAEPKAGEVWTEPNAGIEFVYIPAGCFDMGSDTEHDFERPVHRVCIKQAFMLSKYEISQEQYRTVMSSNPSRFKGDQNPVEQVNWDDAQAFGRELSETTGQRYRLPTEAEWEYACRAGGQHPKYCGGLPDKVAWIEVNSDHKTHPVGQKAPNAWGLYDMSGNVWEWVQDWYVGGGYDGAPADGSARTDGEHKYRMVRGGSWLYSPHHARAAYRTYFDPASRYDSIGFRLARTLP